MSRLLLLHHDAAAAAALARGLMAAGHMLDIAVTWREGLFLAMREEHQLVVITRALPEIGGILLARILRTAGVATPMLLLLAHADDAGAAHALASGIDDYLSAPFTVEELATRVAALARPPVKRKKSAVVWVEDLELDLERRTARRAGRPIPLEGRDFELLVHLARNRGRSVTRGCLARQIGGGREAEARVEAAVRRLRDAVDGGAEVQLIHVVAGVGYVLLGDD